MIRIDLTDSEMLKNFMEIESENVYADLHNAFDCTSIDFSNERKNLTLLFSANQYCKSAIKNVKVIYEDCIIESFSILPEKEDMSFWTIDQMYRGRFVKNDLLEDYFEDRLYYYIDFLGEMHYELFAKRCMLRLINRNQIAF